MLGLGIVVVALAATLAVASEQINSQDLFQQILALPDDEALTDPILFRAREGGRFADAMQRCEGSALPGLQAARLLDGAGLSLLVAASTHHSVVLAFGPPCGEISNDTVQAPPRGTAVAEVPFLADLAPGAAYDAALLARFSDLVDGSSSGGALLADVVGEVSTLNDAAGQPVNLLVSGLGSAGQWAPLAALWAACEYPNAHVLVTTYDMHWPASNAQLNWTFSQLVDQFYLWPASMAPYDAGLRERDLGDVRNDLVDTTHASNLRSGLRWLAPDATEVQLYAENGTRITSLLLPVDGEATNLADGSRPSDTPLRARGGAHYKNFSSVVAAYEEAADTCLHILCKCRFPALLQAAVSASWDDDDGALPLTYLYPDAQLVADAGWDADGAVLWDNQTKAAYFVFRGTESQTDWMVNLAAFPASFPLSWAYEQLFGEPKVATGALQQLAALSYDAQRPEHDLTARLADLSDGQTPRTVVCTGHSLGGSLASLCGPWMALRYPTSAVVVHTAGSPRVGDRAFARLFRWLLGRAYRVVVGRDVVPALPVGDFGHVGPQIWVRGGAYLQETDPPWYESTAEDHPAIKYTWSQLLATAVYAPHWVLNL